MGARPHAFPGGLALPHHKQVSLDAPLRRCPLPDRVFVPVGQHQGESGQVLVETGQPVIAGQALTASEGDFEVPAHAPCAGTVVGLTRRPASHPPGSLRRCVEIRTGAEPGAAAPRRLKNWHQAPPSMIVDHLRQMGLAGMGGAVFPTAAKLRGPWPEIHTLILNGAECEPWIACDESLMRARPSDVVAGGLILAAAAGAGRIILAVEDPMDETAEALRQAARELGAAGSIEVVTVPAVYPEGGERQLIQTLTGLEVPHDGLPQDLGLVCHNVATAAAAFDAAERGRPLTERIVTVTGPGVAQPCNLVAPVGAPAAWLIEQAGGYTEQACRLILGGPMSGTALETDEVIMTKGSNCLLVLDTPPPDPNSVLPCINCGACVEACPASLMPQLLLRAIDGARYQQARDLALFDCIECGCCAQVCPSHIPLVDYYRHAKGELRLRDLDQRRAALARRRHEARQERLAREQAEREARRRARAERLRQKGGAENEIQAAIARARNKKKPAE
ncbi:electron transport complex subunit RsxC [Wenzhouxiangella limi]|uniref:Ion-translocating oxidoreductase complex subunit C n=1 Tax=Wenzhouxiangella limi TaxID=2707351 RepID=A0A845V581_9GAMM|nr:electron transport complex subunit RsxC [Wenzhouxiangella limi]NDY95371.1 electron transport complex subunit RsxC [Wenzhouxiangella limi]